MTLANQLPGFVAGLAAGAAVMAWWGSDSEPQTASKNEVTAVSETVAPELKRTTSAPREESLSASIDSVDSREPMLRAARLTELGYELAGVDLEAAMRKIDSFQSRADKLALLRGIFTRVAQDKPPFQAIQRVKRLERDLESEGFRVLISEWTGGAMPEDANFGQCYQRLLGREDVSDEIKEAWMKAYPEHPQRSDMLGVWASRIAPGSVEEAEALGSHLSGWERQEFLGTLASHWISGGLPGDVWDWIDQNREEMGSEALASVLAQGNWTHQERVEKAFENLTDPQERLAVSAALGQQKAKAGDTKAAMAWADGLPTQAEQDAAHEAIYEATPRGIGAVLDLDEGVVTIRGILDGTPAAEAGLRSGDRIVEVDPGDGAFAPLGNELIPAVELIRGEPGSNLRIRVLRSGGETEVVELKRQQLIFSGK